MNRIILYIISAYLLATPVMAQDNVKKDTDFDGLSDEAEINTYQTDINSPDTDLDGVLDYQEVLDFTNPTDPTSNNLPPETPVKSGFKGLPIFWVVGRVSGIAAFIMFTLVIVMGLTMTSKILLKYRLIQPPDVMQSHAFTATFIAFLLLIIHFTSFMLDDFIKLTILDILIPFRLQRDLSSATGYSLTIPVGLGILAFYLSILLLLTSHLRNKLISAQKWRTLHYSSFLFYILFLIHAYFSGSDSDKPWMMAIYIVSVVLVVVLVLLRIFAKKLFLPKRETPKEAQLSSKV